MCKQTGKDVRSSMTFAERKDWNYSASVEEY